MSYQISIRNEDIRFDCDANETLLDAAERAGWCLPYSCRKGVCASCEGKVVRGDVAVGRGAHRHSGPAQNVRLCQARPLSDVEIEPAYVLDSTPPTRRTLAASVYRIDDTETNVRILHLRFPIGRRIPFQAGQYLRVLLDDGLSRNYSLANPPRDNNMAQLHVRRLPGGRFSETVLGGLRVGDELTVEMPYGLFFLGDQPRPTVLLATGTGFAPMQSMIEHLARDGHHGREVWLYWGGRRRDDLYAYRAAQRWQKKYPWFHFVPVLSRESARGFRAGHVQERALEDHPDLSGYEVYACGSETMVEGARVLLTGRGGLDRSRFHADLFVPAEEADANLAAQA